MPAYRHETYDYGPTFTLADLIAEPARVRAGALAGQGRIGAEAERMRGELGARAARDIGMIGAQKWSTLGQLAGNTLQNIGQYYADAPKREAEARRAEYEQLELTEKKRQTGMQEAVRMILSAPGMMVQDQQTGVKMFDKGKLSQELQAARLDPSVIADALKTAEALDGHAAEFVAGRRHTIAGFAFEVLQAGSTRASVLGAVKSGVENGLFTQRDVQPFLKQIDEQGPDAIFPLMRRLTVGSAYEEQATKILSPADARSKRTKEQLDLMKAESELRPQEDKVGTRLIQTPTEQRIVPDVAGSTFPAAPRAAGMGMAETPPSPSGITLQDVPARDRPYVQGMIDYRLPMPTGYALARSPVWMKRVELAAAVDPTFDVSQYGARQAARKDFNSGKSAQNLRGLNTAVGHIDSLVKASEALHNTAVPDYNAALNMLAQHLPVTAGLRARQGSVTNIRTKFNAVAGELASIFKQSGATDQEIAAWKETVGDPGSASPGQWTAFIDGALELMGSRIGALRHQYEVAMGKPPDFRLLSPASRSILAKLGVDVATLDPLAQPSTDTRPATGEMIRARDPQGNIHEAPAGTPLPPGWTVVR